ncbi:MAG: aminoacetone oxidase family FAD-binding enzyme [Clostridia bacterium]|nr:aminoacetone oxidase family FAD-binding enzyme [Clostridia bacterium]
MNTLIIGGGAAGLCAAIAAARKGEKVTVLERMDRVGKKILATGNGRCNLLNAGPLRYPGNGEFARQVIDYPALKAFFENLGLSLRVEAEGRVYPASGQASSVLDVLRLNMERLGVQVITGCQVTALKKTQKGFVARTSQGDFTADRVILCGGGKAAPKLGSDGSCYKLLKDLGHEITPLRPALTQFRCESPFLKGLSGIRVRAKMWVTQGGKILARQEGEALFTDYGVSGVCAMQLSRFGQEKGCTLHLDLRPALGLEKDALGFLLNRKEHFAEVSMNQFFTGLCVNRLAESLLRVAGISGKTPARQLTEAQWQQLAALVADVPLSIAGVNGFENAQVTWGGADPWMFDPNTMESLICPGLYAAGEVLDVDGDCGGFNLMFAWASGIIAGGRGFF